MHYSIAIAPNLDVDAREFAAAWNGAPEARALAEASVVTQPPQGFPLDPELVRQGLLVLTASPTSRAWPSTDDRPPYSCIRVPVICIGIRGLHRSSTQPAYPPGADRMAINSPS